MKKTMTIFFTVISQFVYAQSAVRSTYQIQETGITKCLLYSDGTEVPVVTYSDNTFTKCGTKTPRMKIPIDAAIRKDKQCDCPGGDDDPYLHLAYTTLSKSQLETLIRTTDPSQVKQINDTIYIGQGKELKKLNAIAGDYFSSYVYNYTKNYQQPDQRGIPAPIPAEYAGVHFDFDSSILKPSSYPTLDSTSADLRTVSNSTILLSGYAAGEGSAAHMMRLAKDRANAVKTYLVNSGIDAKRIKIKAYGETKPVDGNTTEEAKASNRKVDLKIQ